MRILIGAALAAVVLASGCRSTNTVSMNAASALRHGGHRDVFSVGDAEVGPNSELRFCHAQHGCSEWIEASDLRVDEQGVWVDHDSNYLWSEVSEVDVRGHDGIKTTGAIVGVAAVAVIVIPILLVAAYMKALPKDGPPAESSSSSSGRTAAAAVAIAGVAADAAMASAETVESGDPYWGATLRPGVENPAAASRLFSTGARVRAYITLGAFLDSSVATKGDLVTGGAVARLRLASFLELGAGARMAYTKGASGWERAPMYVAQGGFHNQVSARIALPLGVDVAWGDGALAREIRIPWGIRYTSPSGRWTGTLQPVTPSYAKRADADSGRWSINVGLELGVTL
jgi:hypothetical protein